MKGVNKVILIGNLGADPEVRHLDGGNTVANFPLATTESFKNKQGEWVDQTEWHNIVVWGKSAETAEKYLAKGKAIYLEGKLRTRKWEDKDGRDRYTTEVIANTFQFLGKKEEESDSRPTPKAPPTEVGDGLPF